MTSRAERTREASRQRRERSRADLRRAILQHAADLFLEKGYDGFSLRAVAERVGYTPTTIYLYFASKDDLLLAVVREGFERFYAALTEAAASTSDPRARLAALGAAYIRFGREHRQFYQLMFMQRTDLLVQRAASPDESSVDSFGVLQAAVQEAIDRGAFRSGDARAYAIAIWAAVHGLVAISIAMPWFDPAGVERASTSVLQMVEHGFAAR
jgi:AcrR family transcriptional regulator